jgi:small-conductance mechanosensitive channel
MKKYFYLLSILLLSVHAFAQQDTVAYAAQRAKVNSLLTERSTRFGQYDESLNQRTGIFGWQTKRDIKNSNEILRQVVLTDNNIFKELKVLMDYKDLQNQQKVAVADNSQERIERYMQTIKKLQDQNAQLKEDLDKKNKGGLSNYIIAFLILIMAGGFYFFNKKLKKYETVKINS